MQAISPESIPFEYGATPRDGGVDFVLFSRHATAVTLLLYRHADDQPDREIALSPQWHRQGDLWCVHLPGVKAGQVYAYRVDGPADAHRLDQSPRKGGAC